MRQKPEVRYKEQRRVLASSHKPFAPAVRMAATSPSRFRNHDRVVFVGHTATVDRASESLTSLARTGRNGASPGGSGSFATSLAKAGTFMADRSPSPDRTQGSASMTRSGTPEGTVRPRNGASVSRWPTRDRTTPDPGSPTRAGGSEGDATPFITPASSDVVKDLRASTPSGAKRALQGRLQPIPSGDAVGAAARQRPGESSAFHAVSTGGTDIAINLHAESPAPGSHFSPRGTLLNRARGNALTPHDISASEAAAFTSLGSVEGKDDGPGMTVDSLVAASSRHVTPLGAASSSSAAGGSKPSQGKYSSTGRYPTQKPFGKRHESEVRCHDLHCGLLFLSCLGFGGVRIA